MATVGWQGRHVHGGWRRKRYQYVDGDTIWTFSVLTEAQAATLIAALDSAS